MNPEEIFENWIKSEEGLSLTEDATLTEEPVDILRDAFLAGWRKCLVALGEDE